jgi:hypothetical protein
MLSGSGTYGANAVVIVTAVDHTYRYIKPVVVNVGDGLKGTFHMDRSTSQSLETSVQAAVEPSGGPWSVGGYSKETSIGASGTDFVQTGSYHRNVWADYRFTEWKVVACGPKGPCITKYQWKPSYWSGQLTDNNPNTDKGGAVIGVVSYTVPTFDTNPNHQIVLTANGQTSWYRNTAQEQEYGFQFSAAGYLGLKDKASFATGTKITYNYVSGGCSSRRVIWGSGTDPNSAGIVQASCHA